MNIIIATLTQATENPVETTNAGMILIFVIEYYFDICRLYSSFPLHMYIHNLYHNMFL